MKYKTDVAKPKDVKREWYVVDVADTTLGRSASEIAQLLLGKSKVKRSPNMDAGDYVVVVNSDKVTIAPGKEEKKTYFRHSGYPGGDKTLTFKQQMEKDSRFVIEKAVKNMLPKNKLRSERMNRLFVYKEDSHKHTAQKPKEFKLS
jgi:large subunit ribosomal protein L13